MKLDLSIIESNLETQLIGRPQGSTNELWQTIDSTNTRALSLAKEGASAGVIVLAESQTAGRGRFGRSWVSPPGAGLYMSVLLRPESLQANLPLLTIASGLAVARAVDFSVGIKLGLKWVNDLVFAGRKVGGILAELQRQQPQDQMSTASRSSINQAIVIGIGINISSKDIDLPSELSDKAGWLEEIVQGNVDRNVLVSQIAYELEQVLELLLSNQTLAILNAWRKYSATLGERVRALIGNDTVEGLAIDITDSGALIIQTRGGMQELHAGEVSIKKSDGSYC